MSIKIMSYIWEHSPHNGSDLLMMLAIADHANDQGLAWPSLPTLAKKCRVGKRQAIYILKNLEKAGSISIAHGHGRGHLSVYTIKGAVECTFSGKGAVECTITEEKVQPSAPFSEEKVQSVDIKGAIHSTPSGTVRNLKRGRGGDKPSPPPPAKPKRAHRCPADYEPSLTVRLQCQEKWPTVDFDEALEAMRDWEFKDLRSDWDATLRNWIRREAKEGKRRGQPLSRAEQRNLDNIQSTLELEELLNGRNPTQNLRPDAGPASSRIQRPLGLTQEARLLGGPRGSEA